MDDFFNKKRNHPQTGCFFLGGGVDILTLSSFLLAKKMPTVMRGGAYLFACSCRNFYTVLLTNNQRKVSLFTLLFICDYFELFDCSIVFFSFLFLLLRLRAFAVSAASMITSNCTMPDGNARLYPKRIPPWATVFITTATMIYTLGHGLSHPLLIKGEQYDLRGGS